MSEKAHFDVGDAVRDAEAEEAIALFVVDPNRGAANQVFIEDRDATVATLNPGYPKQDRVVACIHREWLERHAEPAWREWPKQEFADRLFAFAREWRLSPKTYDYPASRLEPADSQVLSPVEDRSSTQSTMSDWTAE